MLIFAVSNNSDDERKRKGSDGKDDEPEEDPESGENLNLNDWKKPIDTKENKSGKSNLNDHYKGVHAKVNDVKCEECHKMFPTKRYCLLRKL